MQIVRQNEYIYGRRNATIILTHREQKVLFDSNINILDCSLVDACTNRSLTSIALLGVEIRFSLPLILHRPEEVLTHLLKGGRAQSRDQEGHDTQVD